jgi:uncharacterized protein YkwD
MLRLGLGKLSRSLVVTVLAGALSLTFAWQPAAAATDVALQLPGDPAIGTMLAAEQALLVLTNADRAANGLAPLEFDPETLVIARQRAASQIDVPSLTHFNAEGVLAFVDLLASAKLPYQLAGENLARAYDNDGAVTQRIEQALMRSPLHRKNILEHTFNRVAIGVATDGSGQITFAEVYRN